MKHKRSTVALAFCALGALFSVAEARAQSVELQDDQIRILGPVGEVDTELARGFLNLGINGSSIFNVDSANVIVSATENLYVRRASGLSTVRLDGFGGNIFLGGDGQDGDVILKNSAFTDTIHLEGNTGTAQNSFDGNGFVKGWAQIDVDGSVLGCYRCDAVKTLKFGPGLYFVDFGPISADISSRPALATVNGNDGPLIATDPDVTLLSRVRVQVSADTAFTVVIF